MYCFKLGVNMLKQKKKNKNVFILHYLKTETKQSFLQRGIRRLAKLLSLITTILPV